MLRRIVYSDLTLVNEICLSGVADVSFYSRKSAMISGPELFRCQRWSTVLCRPVQFGEYRCDQNLRSVSGICCESGLRCYVVLIILTGDLNVSADQHLGPLFFAIFGAILVALSSSSLGLSIDTSLETGVVGFEEREVVAVFVGLRDCGPVVLLFFNSFGFAVELLRQ
ncbi:hypothetical protein F511_17677 [Dorcoceras hygrometricum]|uniref:Uncharacterized protein n=1 Tax=Dorcoceras hygrometricum TaxID=472368 RepID=A0A2Z7AZG0_9LAMI|nr:hypothetical protein F511_17677 [Dorcoceras hygrometricum]